MTDAIIRPLTFEDLDDAFRLSTVAGWNQRLDDWRMLLRLAPAGAFAALPDARAASIVGTAVSIDYGGFAWIAMMLVDPAYRGRGVGRRLLEAAIDAVPSHLPVRLDATPLGRRLYQRYGFEDESALSRHVIDPATVAAQRAARTRPAPAAVQPLTDADLAVVVEQDRDTFGGMRGAVLDWAFRGAPQYAYVVRSDSGGAIHYCLGRRGRVFDQIGPVVASDAGIAHALVSAALAATAGRSMAVDVFDPSTLREPQGRPEQGRGATGSGSPRARSRGDSHAAFTVALQREGFVLERPFVRMCRRADSGASENAVGQTCEFAILGPEFA